MTHLYVNGSKLIKKEHLAFKLKTKVGVVQAPAILVSIPGQFDQLVTKIGSE